MNKALYWATKNLPNHVKQEIQRQERARWKGVKAYEPYQYPLQKVGEEEKGVPIMRPVRTPTHPVGTRLTMKFDKGDRTYEVQRGQFLKRVV